MHEDRRRAVLTGFPEAEHCLAIRQRQFVRRARVRRFSWLCRSNRWRRLCLCDEPDGGTINRRPAGCGTQRSPLLRYSGFAWCGGKTSCIATECDEAHETLRKTPCFRGPNGETVLGSRVKARGSVRHGSAPRRQPCLPPTIRQNRGLEGVLPVNERQQSVLAKRNDDGLLLTAFTESARTRESQRTVIRVSSLQHTACRVPVRRNLSEHR
jgi:hypothetical protein